MPKRSMIRKTVAIVCMAGVVLITNTPLVYAYEVHVMNVVANIIDDGVIIGPIEGNFCNDGSFKVELKTPLSGANIYYTIDGTSPVCGKNGNLYSAPFALTASNTVKAVSCHNNIQSLPISRDYKVSYDYCDHTSLKINKVYYYTDQKHSAASCPLDNEWVELYNPTSAAINIKGWKICDGQSCDVLSSSDLSIAAKGYAVVSVKATTWQFWNIPNGTVKIVLGNAIGDSLSNTADMIAIKDAKGNIVDQTNWGTPSTSWANYNSGLWNPGFSASAEGKIFGRVSNGVDTDKISDWTIYSLPDVNVIYPNGGEQWTVGNTYTVKWNASDNKNSLSIDLYYSKDSGATWGIIAKGISNTGSYTWRVPLKIASASDGSDYLTASNKARVKVVATDYTKNFMLGNWDTSDKDFCPPIDLALLTSEEIEYLKTIDTTGLEIINSATGNAPATTVAANTSGNTDNSSSKDSTDTAIKSSEIKNEDGEDYLLGDSTVKGSTAGDSGDAKLPAGAVATDETSSDVVPEVGTEVQAAQTTTAAIPDPLKGSITADEDATTLDFNLNA